jgi:hypothetical protein
VFDRNLLLPDEALQRPYVLDVQAFLRRIGSPMAAVEVQDGGRSVPTAHLLEEVAREANLDVRVLLVKLQVEQSLLFGPPTPARLDWALGFGATDSQTFEEYRGFANQVRAAARALRGYLDGRHPFSVVGLVGRPMKVSDGTVVPRTLATAALYRYTPWIGDRAVGSLSPPFGNCLFYKVWLELFGEEPQAGPGGGWRLVVPPDNWRNPLPLSEEAVDVLGEAARRLGLTFSEDAARKKVYLGQPQASSLEPAPAGSGGAALTYPSGRSLPIVPEKDLGSQSERYRVARPAQAAPLVAADPAAPLSAHFRMGEFLPRDPSYRYVRVAPALVQLLERLRAELGGHPLHVTSGYRPPAYNAKVGGEPLSAHLDGLAADVVSYAVPFERLADTADRLVGDAGGVGRYWAQEFVHVDLRGERARWP